MSVTFVHATESATGKHYGASPSGRDALILR
jgi:hypothetical protein